MATKEELKQKFVTDAIPTEEDFHDLIDLAGQPGSDGEDGEDGTDGSDGFGTEEQYNDIISRLEALEGDD